MSLAGILKSSVNTGLDSDLLIPFVSPISLISNQPIAASDSLNLKRISSDHYAHRWEVDTRLMPTNEEPAYFINSMIHGKTKHFYIRPPQAFRFNGTNKSSGAPVLSAEAGANAKTISISGGTLTPGELINIDFTNDPKLYVVTEVDGNTVSILPGLYKPKAMGATILYDTKATMRVLYDLDTIIGLVYTDGVLSDPGTIKLIEKL